MGTACRYSRERHAHDVAGKQTADGFVAHHHHVSARVFLRHFSHKWHDPLDELLAAFALGRRQASRVLVPRFINGWPGALDFFQGQAFPGAIV